MSDKLLAEWFWTDRWTGSSAFLLPLEARGLYREMLTQAWRRGAQLPNDPEAIRRATGATDGEWTRCWPTVKKFWRVDGDTLVNTTQRAVYADAQARSVTKKARAEHAAAARWNAPSNAPSNACAMPAVSVSVSVSDADATKNPPTPLSAKGGARRYLRADLKKAQQLRRRRFGCPHDPRCDDHVACEVLLAIDIAEQRKAAAR